MASRTEILEVNLILVCCIALCLVGPCVTSTTTATDTGTTVGTVSATTGTDAPSTVITPSTANTASSTAFTVPSTANTASSTAFTAPSTANTESSTAFTAPSTANTATSTANTVASTANTVASTANTVASTANTVASTANTVASTANTAASTANTAASTGNTATSTANSATSTTNTATFTANTATSTANTATSTANTATVTANTATVTANTETSTANTATSTANTAASTANTATFTASIASSTGAFSTVPTTAAAISSLASSAAASTTLSSNTTVNNSYLISLAVLWNGEDVSIEFNRQFNTLIYPALKAACLNTFRMNNTVFSIEAVIIDTLLALDQVSMIQTGLAAQNYLFTGLKSSALTPLLESVLSFTTVPGYPVMQYHTIGPMSPDLLQDALLKVIQQRIRESRYPADLRNFRAALFIDDTIDIIQMTAIFRYFTYGVLFYRYSEATLQSSLVEVKTQGIINIIVLLPAALGDRLKLVAYQLSMFSYQYRWFFHGPRLINADFDTRMITHSLNVTSLEFGRVQDTLRMDLRTTSAVLIYDLQAVWRHYLKQYLCNESAPVNTTYKGFSGFFRLQPDGSMTRLDWHLQIYRGLEARKQHIGEWSSDGSYSMLPMPDPIRTAELSLTELRLNPFRMVTIISPPYVMYKPGVSATAPLKDRLTGMYIEICKQILSDLKFTNYEIFLQADEAFGVLNKTWNGIVRTMMDGRAHMACAPVTIETSRKEVVAFTKVVHSSPQSILYKLPPGDPFSEMFQFLQPLDIYIWLTILGVLAYVAIVLAVMHWIIPNKGIKLKLYDSMFFSFAEVVQGTSGSVPNQLSGRIMVTFFWFFTLFLLLTYIANYAAFRLLDGVQQQVESLQTLLQSSAFEFGLVKNTVTVTLLQSSTFVYMQQMYSLVSDTFVYGLVDNTTLAVQVMQNTSQRYALIGDNLQNQYLTDTNCNLVNTGQFYELKSAMVLPLDNEYGSFFDDQIVRQASRILELQNQFFSVASNSRPDCTDRTFLGYVKANIPSNPWPVKDGALTLTNTLGIAMINLLGCIFALILSAVERSFSRLLHNRSEGRRRTQVAEAYAMAQRPTMLE